ncbi:MAG TPA: DNA repair protein RecO [Pirellulales bacterium]|jgi:DNA repair protein RecO (recombination protein O)|nr:DNA repair protein RecO [Pirellulales bacterium]
MSSEKASALVLRLVDFSETSSVVTLFTREFGKVQALAKGGRRPKGPFESALDLLALCRIVFLRKSSDALDLLTEAKLERRFRPPAGSLSALYAGYYVAELLSKLTDNHDPHPELFDQADEALSALRAGADPGPRVLRFELMALRLLGHLPSLDACADCGAAVPATAGRVPFGLAAGGVLCGTCRTGKKQIVSLSGAALEAMRTLADPRPAAWQALPVPRPVQGELRGLLNRYLTYMLGHGLEMHRYLTTQEAKPRQVPTEMITELDKN